MEDDLDLDQKLRDAERLKCIFCGKECGERCCEECNMEIINANKK